MLVHWRGYIKSQQKFKSNHYKEYTEEVKKIALNSDDDKTLQIFNGTETYPYGTNVFKTMRKRNDGSERFVC